MNRNQKPTGKKGGNPKVSQQTQQTQVSGKTRRNRLRRERRRNMVDGAPVAIGSRIINNGATITGSGDVVRVRHREFVADVSATVTTFETRSFKINPGLVSTFPWLANLAANFEKYRFRRLRFDFKSSVATTTAGSVMMAIDLDSLDSAPATKATMLQMQNVVRSNVWEPSSSTIPESVAELFVRTGAVPTGADGKTYDCGQLIVGTVGAPVGLIGEVWFEYDVELHTPQSTQAAVLSLTASVDDGDWNDSLFVGNLNYRIISPFTVEVDGVAGISYQITMASDDSADSLAVTSGSTALYSATVAGTGSVSFLATRIVRAGVTPIRIQASAAVTPVRKLLVTPVETT